MWSAKNGTPKSSNIRLLPMYRIGSSAKAPGLKHLRCTDTCGTGGTADMARRTGTVVRGRYSEECGR